MLNNQRKTKQIFESQADGRRRWGPRKELEKYIGKIASNKYN